LLRTLSSSTSLASHASRANRTASCTSGDVSQTADCHDLSVRAAIADLCELVQPSADQDEDHDEAGERRRSQTTDAWCKKLTVPRIERVRDVLVIPSPGHHANEQDWLDNPSHRRAGALLTGVRSCIPDEFLQDLIPELRDG